MSSVAEIESRLSAAQLRLRMRHPFFATLALFAPVNLTDTIETAATDGKVLYFNPAYLKNLSSAELDGLLIHEVLHMALLHVSRRGLREPYQWNIACDIVVNGMIVTEGLQLPQGAVIDAELANFSVEEVYDRLPESKTRHAIVVQDIMEISGNQGPTDAEKDNSEVASYWANAREQASIVLNKMKQAGKFAGSDPLGGSREWGVVRQPEVDWRTTLWQYIIRTPVDYMGFDRRFVGRGLYLEALEGESVDVAVCVDTSASVDDVELSQFLSEIQGILSSYPHIKCDLYFSDASLYGPYSIHSIDEVPEAKGGGGTSFKPFFDAVSSSDIYRYGAQNNFIAIYLTDGYATFPSKPDFPILWVVTKCGLPPSDFPYGMVTRLSGAY